MTEGANRAWVSGSPISRLRQVLLFASSSRLQVFRPLDSYGGLCSDTDTGANLVDRRHCEDPPSGRPNAVGLDSSQVGRRVPPSWLLAHCPRDPCAGHVTFALPAKRRACPDQEARKPGRPAKRTEVRRCQSGCAKGSNHRVPRCWRACTGSPSPHDYRQHMTWGQVLPLAHDLA